MKNILLKCTPIIVIVFIAWLGVRHLYKKPSDDEKTHQNSKRNKDFSAYQKGQQTTSISLTPVDYPIELTTQGIVKAQTITNLNALVSGRVIHISPHFQDGAFFQKGDVLAQLDPVDFQSQIITAEASLARSLASLAKEKATAAQALRNWKDIGFDEQPNDLVLRKPQLREAVANVAAQQAALDKAKRNLERASIKAPFNGRVRNRTVGPGQSVGPSTNLGEIYATDAAEIRLPLSSKQLEQITINERGEQQIPVTLTDAISSKNNTVWNASIKHVEGELDESSRELFVIAEIRDPFGITTGSAPLRINQPVKAIIIGNTLKDAYIIDRKHIYGADEVILIEDQKIKRHKINIIWSTPEAIITQDTALKGKTIATSRLSFATDGSPVDIISPETHTQEASQTKTTPKKHPNKKPH